MYDRIYQIPSPPTSTVQPTNKARLMLALASVVLIMTAVLNTSLYSNPEQISHPCKYPLLYKEISEFVAHHTPHKYTHMQVLKRSQYLLLQTASPDALVRLKHSPLADQREELLRVYFQQHHGSLEDFLAHHLQMNGTQGESLLMQVHCDRRRVGGGGGGLRCSYPGLYTS